MACAEAAFSTQALEKERRPSPKAKLKVVKTYLRDKTILPEDGWQHGGRVQRQDLQSGGNQTRDNWSLPERVLYHLQISEAGQAWYQCHSLSHPPNPRLLLPPQVAVANEDSHLVPGGGGMIVVLQRWLNG